MGRHFTHFTPRVIAAFAKNGCIAFKIEMHTEMQKSGTVHFTDSRAIHRTHTQQAPHFEGMGHAPERQNKGVCKTLDFARGHEISCTGVEQVLVRLPNVESYVAA